MRTKNQQSIDKVSEHNRLTLFLQDLVFIARALTGVVSTLSSIIYPLLITHPHYLHQLPFPPPSPPPPE